MSVERTFYIGSLLGIAILTGAAFPVDVRAQQNPVQQVAAPAIDTDDIGGVVTSRFGPEAGVWVIAETTESRHPLRQDCGHRRARPVRHTGPPQSELQSVGARLWLGQLAKVASEPGKILELTAVTAPSLAEAAQYYPAAYWYSMVKIPDQSRFPGTGDKGNGIPEAFKTQDQWLNFIKTNGCGNCHQIGNYATRHLSPKTRQVRVRRKTHGRIGCRLGRRDTTW